MYGTLTWAIRKSNEDMIPSTIVFSIPGYAPYIIYLNYELPAIKWQDLTIDGTSQPNYQGEPLIIIDGQDKIDRGLYFSDYRVPIPPGQTYTNSNFVVKGLHLRHFLGRGILFEHASDILVENNVITQIRNNDPDHSATAIRIVGNPKLGYTNATIRNNYLGTGANLDTTLGCDDAGILVGPDANNNLIFGNTIAYNHQAGIYINTAQQNKISQNLIFGQDSAIVLANGGNENKPAPYSLIYNDSTKTLFGLAEPYDSIEVFGSTGAENANEYLGSTQADGSGNWSVQVQTTQNLFATTATSNNNTSTFNDVVTITHGNKIWIPLNGNNTPMPPICEVIENENDHVTINVELKGFYKENIFVNNATFQKILFPNYATTNDVGLPALPTINKLIQVPDSGNITISIYDKSYDTLYNYYIYPFQFSLLENEKSLSLNIDKDFYSGNNFYPASNYYLSDNMSFRGIINKNLVLKPIKFNPYDSTLQIISSFKIRIDFDKDIDRNNKHYSKNFDNLYKNLIINYSTPTNVNNRATDYNLLIITANQYQNSLNEFIKWKNEKGYKTKLVPLTETGITPTSIRDYIEQEYNIHNIEYVILVGSFSEIPTITNEWEHTCHAELVNGGWGNWYPWSDYGYGCLDGTGDYHPEVLIGRIEVTNINELNNIISKIINYEKNPPFNNWLNTDLLMVHRYYLYQYCPQTISTTTYYNPNPIFDVEDGAYPNEWPSEITIGNGAENQDIIDAINDGRNILNYRGHGDVDGWDENWSYVVNEFDQDDVNALNNGNMTPVIFSIACNTTWPEIENNLGEIFTKPNEKAVAFYGATCSSYSVSNDYLDEEIFTYLYNNIDFHASNITLLATLIMLNVDNYACASKKNARVYLWLGDPTLEIWTDIPQSLLVSYTPNQIDVGNNDITVNISNLAYNQEALVSIYKENDILEYHTVVGDINGEASTIFYNVSPTSYGIINLTVTSHNYLPFEGIINVNMCDESNGSFDSDPLIINPTENVTWNDYNVNSDLVIEEGGQLTIKGTVHLHSLSHVYVKQGGTLIIDGGTLTKACDNNWKGITVEGDWIDYSDPNYVDKGPGQLIMKNYAKIEYAETGVFSNLNGIVNIRHSEFLNCPTGIRLEYFDEGWIPYNTPIPPNLQRVVIERNSFVTDDNFIQTPIAHISLKNSYKIKLRGNDFSNTSSTLVSADKGIGIYGDASNVEVTEFCAGLPCSSPDKSIFDNLWVGINIEDNPSNTVKIKNCEFNNCQLIGALLKSITAPVILSNTFYNDNTVLNAGLYLESCSAYHIEDNTFNKGAIGMVINNSYNDANEVYRNHFNNYNTAFEGYFNNSNPTGDQGLFIHCNDFQNNSTHIYVYDGDVKKQQGNYSSSYPQNSVSAANQFDHNYLSGDNAFKTLNTSFIDYKYWFNMPGDVTDISGYTSPNVDPEPIWNLFDYNSACPSGIPYIHPVDAIAALAAKSEQIDNMTTDLNNLVDGGDTPAALNKVAGLTPRNFNRVSFELLQYAPYLSDTVLVSYMQTPVNGHFIAKLILLFANSPLPPHARAGLDNMTLPPPFKNFLLQYQDGTNAVVQKQEEIGAVRFDRNLILNGVIRYSLNNDSVPEAKDSLVTILENETDYTAKYTLIPLLINMARYDDAAGQIADLQSLAANLPTREQEYAMDYANLQTIALQLDSMHATDSVSMAPVVAPNEPLLSSVANDPNHPASGMAQSILQQAGYETFVSPLFLPEDNKSLQINPQEDNHNTVTNIDNCVDIYPNPTGNELWVEYLMVPGNAPESIDIYTLDGKRIYSKPVNKNYGILQLDVSGVQAGNYIVKIGKYSKQITIVK